jgi:fumarylacetoacetase
MLDRTHDPNRRSWVASANGHPDFPLQNLPLGVFTPPNSDVPRVGVAIGEAIVDLAAAHHAGLFSGDSARAAALAGEPRLNALMGAGRDARTALRGRLADMLSVGASEQSVLERMLHPATTCTLHLPARVGDYTDFYAGIHHATNVGRQFRPDNPLLPNYKHVPIGYHGRSSSVCASGTPVRRPRGQRRPPADEAMPVFGPSRRLDFELELAVWIGLRETFRRGNTSRSGRFSPRALRRASHRGWSLRRHSRRFAFHSHRGLQAIRHHSIICSIRPISSRARSTSS